MICCGLTADRDYVMNGYVFSVSRPARLVSFCPKIDQYETTYGAYDKDAAGTQIIYSHRSINLEQTYYRLRFALYRLRL